jgi:long-subunit fatty acid transport protein
MRSKLSALFILVCLLINVPAFGEINFGPNVEADTSEYFTIMDYFLSPYQLLDYNFLGGGARARAMGGAFLAVSDDAAAASWNPAGLIQMDKAQMDLSFSSLILRADYATSLDSRVNFGDDLKYDKNAISFASVVLPFQLREKEVAAGIFFQRLADVYQEKKYYMEFDTIYTNTGLQYDVLSRPIDDRTSGKLDVVNLSVSTKIVNPLSIGFGVNLYTGKYTNHSYWFLPLVSSGDTVVYVPDEVGETDGFRFYPQIESKYSGVNVTAGLMYMMDKLRLAAVVKTPFHLHEDNDVKLFTDQVLDGVVLPSSYLLSKFFKAEREWKMPTMLGFGGSYQLNKLTLAADVEVRNYSETEVTYKRNIADPSTNEVTTGGHLTEDWWVEPERQPPSVRSLGWRNVTQFRIGAEYMITTGIGTFPLRVGFRNDPQLYTTRLDSSWVYFRYDTQGNDLFLQSKRGVESGDWVDGSIVSFGTGVAWSQIKLDITFEFASYPDVERNVVTGWIPYDPGLRMSLNPQYAREFDQKESLKYSRIIASFTGFF